MTAILPASQVHAVYDVLVDEAGASEAWRRDFVYAHTIGHCFEYRLQGEFGEIGAKFWSHNWQVTPYPEDDIPQRRTVLDRVNASLAELRSPR